MSGCCSGNLKMHFGEWIDDPFIGQAVKVMRLRGTWEISMMNIDTITSEIRIRVEYNLASYSIRSYWLGLLYV